ncbi:NADH-quinone oxidoreductase subunit E/F [Anoxybacterium hadale]|uniref:NADH-quinone oxidoreductase subunit E/F n=1 Tax=Anoxybacterium hadale TaxID=3408580 RepID=A0ACD1A859_9FIRM|nr:NADH-quinone oxidoreductase subunit E/F [Clostridiales bacterium]
MKVIIDGLTCEAESGEYLLQIAKRNHINIPTLCHEEALAGLATCRICIVEVMDARQKAEERAFGQLNDDCGEKDDRKRKIVTACVYPVVAEIEVLTNSEKLRDMRKAVLTLLMARAPQSDAIGMLAKEYGVEQNHRWSSREDEKCILCGLCVAACDKMGTGAIATVNRGTTRTVSTPFEEPAESCIGCCSCASVCPSGAIPFTDLHGKRTIWNKEFELVSCSWCGEVIGTKEQLEYVGKRNGPSADVHGGEMLCEHCRAVREASRLKWVSQPGRTFA